MLDLRGDALAENLRVERALVAEQMELLEGTLARGGPQSLTERRASPAASRAVVTMPGGDGLTLCGIASPFEEPATIMTPYPLALIHR